jgi:RimJ/RimL family protein N-acetyltransferase
VEDRFVPDDFEVPDSYEGSGFRLEPLGPQHNDRDHVAWMSSVDHVRSTPGFDSPEAKWPTPMPLEQNEQDLIGHARDFAKRRGFTYSILDGDEVIGCVYIYPARRPDQDAEVRSWVRESRAHMDTVVWKALSAWIETNWPFSNPFYAPRA